MNAVPETSQPIPVTPLNFEISNSSAKKKAGRSNGAASASVGAAAAEDSRSTRAAPDDPPPKLDAAATRSKAPEVTPRGMKGLVRTRSGTMAGLSWRHVIPIVVGVAIVVAGIGFLIALFLGY